MPDDADLARQAAQGDSLALKKLLLLHYGPLSARIEKKIPSKLRSLIATEDILQEVFAEAFGGIAGFVPGVPDAFYRWLVTIADHRLVDAVRTHRAAKRGGGRVVATMTRSSVAPLVDLVAVTERTPSVSAAGHEAAAAVQIGLAALPPELREALTLRYLRGLPVAEAAARMGRSQPSMHKLCSRALQALRDAMGVPGPTRGLP